MSVPIRNSLRTRVLRRAIILSLIAIIAIFGAAFTGIIATLESSRIDILRYAAVASKNFELFFASIQLDISLSGRILTQRVAHAEILAELLERNSAIVEIAEVDVTGAVRSRRRRMGVPVTSNYARQPWLTEVRLGRVWISPVATTAEGFPYLTIAAPIDDENSDYLGALVATVDLTAIWAEVTAIRVGEMGYAYLVDNRGKLLAYHDISLVQQGVDVPGRTGRSLNAIIGSNDLLGIGRGLNGQIVLSGGFSLRSIDWYAVIEVPMRQIVIGSLFQIGVLIASLAVSIALVYGLLQFVRQSIVEPLQVLTRNVNAIRAGDLKARVTIPTNQDDEIGLLTTTINEMAENIENRTQELVQANRLASESARLKSEFLATISHELRTPLNAIIGFGGVLLGGLDGQIDDRARRILERMEANSKRLMVLIEDLLDISKIETGRMEILKESVPLRDLFAEWSTQMRELAMQRGLHFEATCTAAVPESIISDRRRLNQIAWNLLSNALKFTERGKIALRVDVSGDNFVIQVTDTGIGIPPQAINYIFDEFRQVDGSARRPHDGTGLGLAIAHRLCQLMSGSIGVVSNLGEGSTFTVTLPLLLPESLMLTGDANPS